MALTTATVRDASLILIPSVRELLWIAISLLFLALRRRPTPEDRDAAAVRQAHDQVRAFEELLQRYEGPIFRIAYRLTGNREDAEDLVQESVIDAFRSFNQFDMGTHFDRWMRQIITHNFIDRHRKEAKMRVESLDQSPDDEDDDRTREIPDVSADPGKMVVENQMDEPVQRALSELPVEFRVVVVLSDVEACTYEEIAQQLCIPIGTVRSRLNRARTILRKKLASYARERYRI